jgi:hypothetical protein
MTFLKSAHPGNKKLGWARETSLDQMLLPSDTSFVLNFKAKVNKMENKQVEVKAKV